ncbi:MAG: urease accessory protein UreF [Rhizobiaceae bacterium]
MKQTAILRLMMLLSPSFPVGAFAYSSGLEQAVAEGMVADATGLQAWLETAIVSGPLWNDAVLLNAAYEDEADLSSLSELALALAGSQERHMETLNLGRAFAGAAMTASMPCPDVPNDIVYPVAVGAVAKANAIDAEAAVCAYLHAFVSNQIQCAIRLGVTGQSGGVALLAGMEPLIAETGAKAATSSLDALGSNMIFADIASMRHETLYSRIFRS